MKPKDIIEKYRNGDTITNEELVEAIVFFRRLADDLFRCGDLYRLTALDASNMANQLDDYRSARGLPTVPYGDII